MMLVMMRIMLTFCSFGVVDVAFVVFIVAVVFLRRLPVVVFTCRMS